MSSLLIKTAAPNNASAAHFPNCNTIKHTWSGKQLFTNAEHVKNTGVMMSTVSSTLVIVHTHTLTHRAPTDRERARQRGWTTHQHLHSLQPRHIKAFSAHLSVCVPVNQKAYFEHAHTHARTSSDCICFVQQHPGLGRRGKGFRCRRGNYLPQLTLSGRRGGWLFTRSEWGKERKEGKDKRGQCCVWDSAFFSASHLLLHFHLCHHRWKVIHTTSVFKNGWKVLDKRPGQCN